MGRSGPVGELRTHRQRPALLGVGDLPGSPVAEGVEEEPVAAHLEAAPVHPPRPDTPRRDDLVLVGPTLTVRDRPGARHLGVPRPSLPTRVATRGRPVVETPPPHGGRAWVPDGGAGRGRVRADNRVPGPRRRSEEGLTVTGATRVGVGTLRVPVAVSVVHGTRVGSRNSGSTEGHNGV